jgi:formate dehydrogenase subunit beta
MSGSEVAEAGEPRGSRNAVGDGGPNGFVRGLLSSLLEKGGIDAVVVPTRVPSGESFVLLLTRDREMVASSTPLPPVMPMQGARALLNLMRRGPVPARLLCVMRPCEIRAAVELTKLRQVNLEKVVFLSIDCPGAFPTRDYIHDPEMLDGRSGKVARDGGGAGLRPACRNCVRFSSRELPTDLHVGTAGIGPDEVVLVPVSEAGRELLAAVGFECKDDISDWRAGVDRMLTERQANRATAFDEMKAATADGKHLGTKLADCVNCHNCMRVCPICYCRQCHFDSPDALQLGAREHFARALHRGGARMPGGMLEFHLGRMYHMVLSCVGCGACEDGCPMDVPVGQVFNYVGSRVQDGFEYVPGRSRDEVIPTLSYEVDELHSYEDAGTQE